ncbi:hypothetical protein V1264_022541 [Littorina saxatilis]|uniref:Ig-like domain-containing protein n=1 Tax=Littorina saxatilis TaxID=31220 RepID=A0AAN9FZG3_9CAEN
MKMASLLTTFCIFILSTFGMTSCFEWETLPKNVVYSCVGRKVEFPWGFKADGAGLIRDIRWLFNGVFDSMMVATEAYGYFFPTTPYSQRVRQLTNGGLELSDVTLADAGNYTVEVNVEVEGSLVSHRHSALLQVGDGLMTQGGTLTASQDPVALWDSSDHQWTIRLTCGLFNFLGQPPVQVIWTTPTMATTASSGYDNGHFYLTLSSPVKGGNYTCHIPHHLLSDVCVTESNHGNHRVTSSVLVGEVEARLSLLEAEQRTLNAKLSNLSSENMELGGGLQVIQTLTDESTDNLTLYISEQLETVRKELRREVQDLRGIAQEQQGQQRLLGEQLETVRKELRTKVQDLWGVTADLLDGPCASVNHTVLSDASRAVTHGTGLLCDKSLTLGWYRFVLNGSPAVIPTQCVELRHCGTGRPYWLDLQGKELPAAGQETDARACGTGHHSNCCELQKPISVRNCGAFFVYKLTPFSKCNRAYCAQEMDS